MGIVWFWTKLVDRSVSTGKGEFRSIEKRERSSPRQSLFPFMIEMKYTAYPVRDITAGSNVFVDPTHEVYVMIDDSSYRYLVSAMGYLDLEIESKGE